MIDEADGGGHRPATAGLVASPDALRAAVVTVSQWITIPAIQQGAGTWIIGSIYELILHAQQSLEAER